MALNKVKGLLSLPSLPLESPPKMQKEVGAGTLTFSFASPKGRDSFAADVTKETLDSLQAEVRGFLKSAREMCVHTQHISSLLSNALSSRRGDNDGSDASCTARAYVNGAFTMLDRWLLELELGIESKVLGPLETFELEKEAGEHSKRDMQPLQDAMTNLRGQLSAVGGSETAESRGYSGAPAVSLESEDAHIAHYKTITGVLHDMRSLQSAFFKTAAECVLRPPQAPEETVRAAAAYTAAQTKSFSSSGTSSECGSRHTAMDSGVDVLAAAAAALALNGGCVEAPWLPFAERELLSPTRQPTQETNSTDAQDTMVSIVEEEGWEGPVDWQKPDRIPPALPPPPASNASISAATSPTEEESLGHLVTEQALAQGTVPLHRTGSAHRVLRSSVSGDLPPRKPSQEMTTLANAATTAHHFMLRKRSSFDAQPVLTDVGESGGSSAPPVDSTEADSDQKTLLISPASGAGVRRRSTSAPMIAGIFHLPQPTSRSRGESWESGPADVNYPSTRYSGHGGDAGLAAEAFAHEDKSRSGSITPTDHLDDSAVDPARIAAAAALAQPLITSPLALQHESLHPLAAACHYLDAVDLARSSCVSSVWRRGLEAAPGVWRACVRAPGGVPPEKRCGFYVHVLYGRPSWWQLRGTASLRRSAVNGAGGGAAASWRRPQGLYSQLCKEAEVAAAVIAERGDDDSITSASVPGENAAAAKLERQLATSFRIIDQDLERTWPGASVEDEESSSENVPGSVLQDAAEAAGGGTSSRSLETRAQLRNILRAFSLYSRRVSYCQGMNFLALSLLEAGGNEEDAFWALCGFSDRLAMEGMWCPGLHRLEFALFALDQLLQKHVPALAAHFTSIGISLGMFASRWFVTLFSCHDTFGRTAAARVLDLFVVERWPALLAISVAVLRDLSPRLLTMDLEGVLHAMQFSRGMLFGLAPTMGRSGQVRADDSLCERMRSETILSQALALEITDSQLRDLEAAFHLGTDGDGQPLGGDLSPTGASPEGHSASNRLSNGLRSAARIFGSERGNVFNSNIKAGSIFSSNAGKSSL